MPGPRRAGPGPVSSLATPSHPDLFRGGSSSRGDQQKRRDARPAHLCPRHQRPAGRPDGHGPLRRARSRASGRRGHGVGGQAASSGARLLRPAGAAAAGRVPRPVRPARRPHPDRGTGRHAARRAQPLRPRRPARRLPAGGQRLADPRGGPQSPGRGVRRHGRLQGPAAADQGVVRRAPRRGVPRGARHHGAPAGPEWPS